MAQQYNRNRFKCQTDKNDKDFTIQYTQQINMEIETLFIQQYRIAQIQSEIRSETDTMNKKLLSLTNQKWTQDIDIILGHKQFDALTQQANDLHTQFIETRHAS